MKRNTGYTLMELLVVIGIMMILMAMATVGYSEVQKKSLDARRKSDLEILRQALELCRNENVDGVYPDLLSSLSNCSGKNILNVIPKDPKTGDQYAYTPDFLRVTYTLTAVKSDGSPIVVLNP